LHQYNLPGDLHHSIIHGSHSHGLVVLSVIIAVLAAYTALELASRVHSAGRSTRKVWLAGGAFTFGAGIWSMHFTSYEIATMVSVDEPV
jgi:NO-binding membrane sensor protein with MHYT domain